MGFFSFFVPVSGKNVFETKEAFLVAFAMDNP